MNSSDRDLDTQLRCAVYEETMRTGLPPSSDALAADFAIQRGAVLESLARLASARELVLQRDGEVLMASPFSAVPTPFVVQLQDRTVYGNCIWDALGVMAMTGADGTISASCGDCGTAMNLGVTAGTVHGDEGLIHFAIPARHWWDDIVFNCKTMHFFQSEEHIDRWCRQWRLDRGAVLSIDQAWRLALAWYAPDRRDPGWRRKTAEEVATLFAEIGLTGEFWSLG